MRKKILIGLLSSGLFLSVGAYNLQPSEPLSPAHSLSIKSVERVCVTVSVGHAPSLPYQLWVNYSDGKGEYRQVKWLNASEATEKAEAKEVKENTASKEKNTEAQFNEGTKRARTAHSKSRSGNYQRRGRRPAGRTSAKSPNSAETGAN